LGTIRGLGEKQKNGDGIGEQEEIGKKKVSYASSYFGKNQSRRRREINSNNKTTTTYKSCTG